MIMLRMNKEEYEAQIQKKLEVVRNNIKENRDPLQVKYLHKLLEYYKVLLTHPKIVDGVYKNR